MASLYPSLTTYLDEAGTDGYLIHADGDDSNQYYLSGFRDSGSFVTLYADGDVRLLVPDLTYARARENGNADGVRRFSAFDYGDLVAEHGRAKAGPLATAAFLSVSGIDSVSVPASFPTGTTDVLRDHGITVITDYDDTVERLRAVKTDEEITYIEETQRATESAMAVVAEMLERATVEGDVLHLEGAVLTSERVRGAIESSLNDEGCEPTMCIVASGAEGALGHAVGTGPIEPGEPIIVDIAPRNEASGYVADMTRTFVKGEPGEKIREWYDVTREAYDVALDVIEPGVTGEAVNDAVCDVFEREGYQTLRTDESIEDGFIHPTGHGVGLDVHEQPKLSWGGGELRPGHVVAVEPGMYQQGVGGVRLEDLVVVTETGYDDLTDHPRKLGVV